MNQIADRALSSVSRFINLDQTTKDDFVFFYDKYSPFSQFYPAEFTVNDQRYNCAEQYMMYQKAVTFNDGRQAQAIMREQNPSVIKRLGRVVANFDETVWRRKSVEVVRRGNFEKFSQNPHLLEMLISTFPRILAEASPHDCIWGIGHAATSRNAHQMSTWRGHNQLGLILMELRDFFINN